MAFIEVITDPKIKQTEVKEILSNPSSEEVEGTKVSAEVQTKQVGIISPLIELNNTVVNYDQVTYFELNCEGLTPTCKFSINDGLEIIKSLDQPKADNQIRIVIVPPFEETYKKINLTFFISSINIDGNIISVTGIYKVPKLYESQLKSFGEITTYELIEQISNETELGFASNIQSTDDKRFIYCPNINYLTTIEREINFGGNDKVILDCWIDYWNYINLVDIFERYNAIDKDLTIWSTNSNFQQPDADIDPIPVEMPASISNNPVYRNSQLYTNAYKIINKTGNNLLMGTDRVLSVFMQNKGDSEDMLLQDGDVQNDIFAKYYYLGEQFGEHKSLLYKECNKIFKQKITGQSIELNLKSPVLGLMRGHKVDILWYDTNNEIETVKNELDINSNIEVPEDDNPNEKYSFHLNKQVSGQYLIYKTKLLYNKTNKGNFWNYKLTLIRPQNQINSYKPNTNE